MNTIQKFVESNNSRLENLSIAVVGDAMIDEVYDVKADRISPEFPVPVLLSNSDRPNRRFPGGAANIVSQFRHFNVGTTLYCFADKSSGTVFNSGSYDRVKLVPRKKRFYANGFPLCRWDVELPNYGCGEKTRNKIHRHLHERYTIVNPVVTILSDYNKGFFNDYGIKLWVDSNRITIVDPKKGPVAKWRGCTIIKPNAKEAKELSGETNWKRQCDYFVEQTQCKACIITQGGDGVVAKIDDKYFEHRVTKNVPIKSVVGAGDTFAAFLAMAYGFGLSIEESIEIAHEAGAVYVQDNEPVYPQKLSKLDWTSKIVDPSLLKERGFAIAFANGCFDIITEAHIDLLKFAKQQANKLVVALNDDESVKKLKGSDRPVNSLKDRMRLLAEFDFVDYVVSFKEETPLKMIQEIMPEVIVKGGDYQESEVVGSEFSKVKIFPYKPGISTTAVINRIRNQ